MALFILPLFTFAYDAEVDGIYYNLVPKAKEAKVTSGDKKYTGDVVIPPSFTHDGVIYKVTKIENNAFYGCDALTSISIPNTITEILGDWNVGGAFCGCSGLTSITIPNSVTFIGEGVFRNCYKLSSITLPNDVTTIGSSAFRDCTSLKSITLPDGITSIEAAVFSGCTSLISVSIPNSVTTIKGNDLFGLIPGSFEGCASLTSITIPNSVTMIGNGTFSKCSNLASITLSTNLLSIGNDAFVDCTSLTGITIPASVKSIGINTFHGCTNLTTITFLGQSQLQGGSFAHCKNLADVYCYANSVYAPEDCFHDSYVEYATLHVPADCIEAYKNTAPWSSFGKIVSLTGEEGKEQCAAPTISYANGTLTFACETKDAKIEYNYTISANGSGSAEAGGVKPEYTLTVKAWANAEGYEASDTVTATFESSATASGNKGDVNEDGKVDISDIVAVINIIAGK